MSADPGDDRHLVCRALGGDVAAFEEIVRRHEEIAFRVAYVIAQDPEVARDAAQSALVKAYYALRHFDLNHPLRPWLLRIVSNEARNHVRSRERRRGYEGRSTWSPGGDQSESAEEAALTSLEGQSLVDAVRRLPAHHRAVIECRYFLELSEAETANVLRCPRGTVKSRTARALEQLRRELASSARQL